MPRTVKQKYVRTLLNTSQITLLDLVYKYRFVKRELVAESLNINNGSSLHERFEVLVKNGYLAKRFEKRMRLLGVHIAYYLTPKGLRALQTLGYDDITDTLIKASYRDKTVGQSFIDHTLSVYDYTNVLKAYYPDLKVFTKREIAKYSYFPEQLPDAFLSLPGDNPKQPTRFFFDFVPDTLPRTALDRRIANYCEFFDEGGWDSTNSPLPMLLLVCEWGAAERRIQRNIRAQLSRADMGELEVYTTTTGALDTMTKEAEIWTSVEDTEELITLNKL